jgi:hypothetical protein
VTPDPVVLDAIGGSLPRNGALADVVRTTAAGLDLGWALGVFAQLPGLTLVVVDLPGGLIAFVTRQGQVCTAQRRAGLVEDVYRSVVADQSNALSRCRATSTWAEPSEPNASSAAWK